MNLFTKTMTYASFLTSKRHVWNFFLKCSAFFKLKQFLVFNLKVRFINVFFHSLFFLLFKTDIDSNVV